MGLDMDLLLVIVMVAVVLVLALLLVLALGIAAKAADGGDQETGWLSALASLRSPSGKPFFANRKAMRDFVETLDDARDEPPRS
jgi:hypothetical protein